MVTLEKHNAKDNLKGPGVYISICLECHKSYAGETGLRLETRVPTRCQKSAGIESFDFQFYQRAHNINRRQICESEFRRISVRKTGSVRKTDGPSIRKFLDVVYTTKSTMLICIGSNPTLINHYLIL